ncbi:uncharacterized protein LOC102804786 isoform X2 [Saccoglossus kowalevskii]
MTERRKRVIANTKILRTMSEEKQFVQDVDQLTDSLVVLKKKLEDYREKKRVIRSKANGVRRKTTRSLDDVYVDFMFRASAACLVLYVAMHIFRLIMIIVFPQLLMECAIIVQNETDVHEISSFSIAQKILLGSLLCDECGFHNNDTCSDVLSVLNVSEGQ